MSSLLYSANSDMSREGNWLHKKVSCLNRHNLVMLAIYKNMPCLYHRAMNKPSNVRELGQNYPSIARIASSAHIKPTSCSMGFFSIHFRLEINEVAWSKPKMSNMATR